MTIPEEREWPDFRYIRINIHSKSARTRDLRVYPTIGDRLAPWRAYHPEEDFVRCYTSPLNVHLHDHDRMIAYHNQSKMANVIHRPSDFLKNFPRLPKDLGHRFPQYIVGFINTCAQYCGANKCYMPSAHMM